MTTENSGRQAAQTGGERAKADCKTLQVHYRTEAWGEPYDVR